MTERRLPPALHEKVRWDMDAVTKSDLLDWLYGKEPQVVFDQAFDQAKEYIAEGNPEGLVELALSPGTPGLVERVRRRADSLYLSESDIAGPVLSSADYMDRALRAELGMEDE